MLPNPDCASSFSYSLVQPRLLLKTGNFFTHACRNTSIASTWQCFLPLTRARYGIFIQAAVATVKTAARMTQPWVVSNSSQEPGRVFSLIFCRVLFTFEQGATYCSYNVGRHTWYNISHDSTIRDILVFFFLQHVEGPPSTQARPPNVCVPAEENQECGEWLTLATKKDFFAQGVTGKFQRAHFECFCVPLSPFSGH